MMQIVSIPNAICERVIYNYLDVEDVLMTDTQQRYSLWFTEKQDSTPLIIRPETPMIIYTKTNDTECQ